MELPAKSHRIDTKTLEKLRRSSDLKLFLVVFVVALGLAPMLTLAGLNIGFGTLLGLLLAVGIAVLTVRWPVFGLFISLAAAVVIEEGKLPTGSDFTDQLYVFYWPPRWEGLFERPIGMLFLLILVVMIIHHLIKRERLVQGGGLMPAFGFFMLCVAMGVVHGLATGGSFKIIVLEVRPLWYLFVMYLLAYNLIASSKQIRAFFWIVIIAAGVKGLQGVYLLVVVLHGSPSSANELMAHEDSFFFVSLLLLIVLFCLQHRYRAQLYASLIVLAPVLVALVANQRRADYIALLLGLCVAWCLIFLVKPQKRKMLISIALTTLVLGAVYVAIFANGQGSLASPARSIIAVFHPNSGDIRDIQSNLYRVVENYDLKFTVLQNPLLGQGFGKEFLTPWPLADISAIDQYYLYIPHNTIYWIWMRLGPLGYLSLWFLFGSMIVRGCLVVRTLKDSYLQMVGIYIVAVILMEIVVAFADYQLFFYRNVIYMGLLAGILMKLPVIEQKEMLPQEAESAEEQETPPVPAVANKARHRMMAWEFL